MNGNRKLVKPIARSLFETIKGACVVDKPNYSPPVDKGLEEESCKLLHSDHHERLGVGRRLMRYATVRTLSPNK